MLSSNISKVLLILVLFCLFVPSLYADWVTDSVAAGDGPQAISVNPITNKIYVANTVSGNVTVIDGATNDTTTVDVGSDPYSVVVNTNTNKIYVTNAGDNSVTVIDGATDLVDTTIDVGEAPIIACVNPTTNMIYTANGGGSSER